MNFNPSYFRANEYLDFLTSEGVHVHFSQFGEDVFIVDFFGGKQKGFYVDIGAHHPTQGSNTALLHKRYGWHGINIDANPDALPLFQKARPNDLNLCCGIGNTEGVMPFYRFKQSSVNTFDKEQAERQKTNFEFLDVVQIPIKKLSTVLQEHIAFLPKDQQIDYMNIDVEALDFEVLSSNDFNLFKPKLISIEMLNYHTNMEGIFHDKIYKMLTELGYRFRGYYWVTAFFENTGSKTSKEKIQIKDESSLALIKEANRLLNNGQYAEAEILFKNLFVAYPNSFDILKSYAFSAMRLNHWKDAAERYKLGMSLFPDNQTFVIYYASCLTELKDYDAAENILLKLKQNHIQDNESWMIYYYYATIHTRRSSFRNALSYWQEGYDLYPQLFAIRLHYGKALLESDRNEEAKNIFEKMIADDIKHTGVYEGYAKALFRVHHINQLNAVIENTEKALVIAPDDYNKHYLDVSLANLNRYLDNSLAIIRFKQICDSYNLQKFFPFIEKSVLYKLNTNSTMADTSDHIWSKSGVEALYQIIKTALDTKQPFSLIRLGDGEALVLAKEKKCFLGVTSTATIIGPPLNNEEFEDKLSLFHSALFNCDVLGLPSEKLIITSIAWQKLISNLPVRLNDMLFNSIKVTDWESHYHLYWSGLLEKLIANRDFLGYISNHCLDEQLQNFNIKKVKGYLIPGEHMYRLNLKAEAHYPKYYNEIIDTLEVPYPGALFLVGAGALGKIYCNIIKQRGGVALDVGAVMDCLAGNFDTRITFTKAANRGFLPLGENA